MGDKQGYFLQTSVGASGLCFGLQVCSFICSLFACCVVSSKLMHVVLLHTVYLSVLTISTKQAQLSLTCYNNTKIILIEWNVTQVVADYTRQGTASVMNLTAIPVRFSCWSHLAVTQALLSCDHVSFKGHLSGILAGLLHVFLPKAGGFMLTTEHVEKKRKDYAFRCQLNEKPSVIPGCPPTEHVPQLFVNA